MPSCVRLTHFLVPLLAMQVALGTSSLANTSPVSLPGVSSYIAASGFPTSAFSSYYVSPAFPTREPQPIIYDPVLDYTFPYELTNPDAIPEGNDEVFFPAPVANLSLSLKHDLVQAVVTNVTTTINSGTSETSCDTCKSALAAAKSAALFAPHLVPKAIVSLCKALKFKSDDECEGTYSENSLGPIWTQVLAFADVEGLDGQYICHSLQDDFCPRPRTRPLDTSNIFPKPKPDDARPPKASGKRIKVLHMSDIHLDPRYAVNSEADCSSSLCCRSDKFNDDSEDDPLLPASSYGSFRCDSPYNLALAALQAVGPLTGTGKGPENDSLAFTLYTGDLQAHDPHHQGSREYLEYIETSVFEMFKKYLTGPVFVTLGNHDSSPPNINAPYRLPGRLGEQSSWNYEHVAGLWLHEGWISRATADEARTHYGGYSVKTRYGLRIISLNTDFWHHANILNFINTTNPDNSGMLTWLIEELQKAEDAGERVWIIGHVLSGWDGYNPLPDPTNLFYQIIDRYSPHVIANTFWGHSHEDQFMVYYANNGTVQSKDTALATGWVCPGITPINNLNSGFRLYEVDTGDFNIYESYNFYSNVSDYPDLSSDGPTFQLEYSTRDTFGPAAQWSKEDPLNATFWHGVTEAMEDDPDLVELHNSLQGKLSVKVPDCTSDACHEAKICYMRSGSAGLGYECPQGYGSVQSPFKGK